LIVGKYGQEVKEHCLHIQRRSINQMPADSMTKILPRHKHIKFIQQLHLIDIRSKVQKMEKIVHPFIMV
jgi:hypothetical protein